MKYNKHENADTDSKVALFTRAWIEIFVYCFVPIVRKCRPLHEGVD